MAETHYYAWSPLELAAGELYVSTQHLPCAIRFLFPHRKVLPLVGDSLPGCVLDIEVVCGARLV